MFCVALCDDNEDFLKLEDLVVHQYMEQKHIDCQIEHFKDGEALLLQSVENYDLVLLDTYYIRRKMTDQSSICWRREREKFKFV